jgi:DNA-binding MarR family transcriptional regulator
MIRLPGADVRRSRSPGRVDRLVDRAINVMFWKLRRQASILESVTQGTSRPDPADLTLPLDPDEDAAWRALARAVIVVPRVLDADLIEGAGLNLAEYIALVELSEAPGRALRMSELATLTDLSRSGLSRLIERLVRQGLVSREPFADDGRGRVAQLTEAGLRRLEQAYPHALASVRRNVMRHLARLDLPAFAEAVGNFAPDDAYAPARRTARS